MAPARAENTEMRRRVLAAAQTVPVAGNVEANLDEHLVLAELAAKGGAHVLVFPELSLTGYEMSCAAELAFALEDERLDILAAAAQRHEMTVVVGAPLRSDDLLHIAAVVLGADGVRSAYTKQHLGAFPESAKVDGLVPPAEASVFSEGTLNPMVDVSGHQAMIAVCADANRPAHAERAAEAGATTYLASTFVIRSEFAQATANLADRAKRHGMAVVFSNYGGRSGGLQSAGRSGIWANDGTLLGSLPAQGSGVLVATEERGTWRVATFAPEV